MSSGCYKDIGCHREVTYNITMEECEREIAKYEKIASDAERDGDVETCMKTDETLYWLYDARLWLKENQNTEE